MSDPLANTKKYAYDRAGRALIVTDALGGNRALAETIENPESEQNYRRTVNFKTPLGRSFSYITEFLGSSTIVSTNRSPHGYETKQTSPSHQRWAESEDNLGSKTRIEFTPHPRFPERMVPSSVTDNSGTPTQVNLKQSYTTPDPSNYQALSTYKLETESSDLGKFTASFDRTTRTWAYSSPSGRQKKEILDAKGRIIQSQIGALTPISLSYNTNGLLTQVKQGTRTGTFTYNTRGLPASYRNPLGQTTSWLYDAAGRVTQETLANGVIRRFAYNARGDLLSLTPAGTPPYQYTYDKAANPLTETEPALGTTTFRYAWQYSPDFELLRTTLPNTQTIARQYDSGGRLSSLATSGWQRAYAYQATGLIESITQTTGTLVNRLKYQ
jgi:YD repeat-containing protein